MCDDAVAAATPELTMVCWVYSCLHAQRNAEVLRIALDTGPAISNVPRPSQHELPPVFILLTMWASLTDRKSLLC
eukprot:6199239-Pleurochrysis_carterae.AAC.6